MIVRFTDVCHADEILWVKLLKRNRAVSGSERVRYADDISKRAIISIQSLRRAQLQSF